MRFNINRTVKVRLTEHGRAIHRKNHDELMGEIASEYPYTPPVEDSAGWSTWQMWVLMREFGPFIGNGFVAPLETEIEIPDSAHKTAE